MFAFKYLILFLTLCLIRESCCKPTENDLTQGRGIGSTIWGWITYPFSWWGSGEVEATEVSPVQDQLTASSTNGPYDNIEIAKHNITIWCNDHTCTTMKCDKIACKNTTCNIYDTDVNGRCREYNMGMKPEEPVTPKPTETTSKPSTPNTVTEAPASAPEVTSAASTMTQVAVSQTTTQAMTSHTVEHPLELEAALSSTVTEENAPVPPPAGKVDKSSPHNKI